MIAQLREIQRCMCGLDEQEFSILVRGVLKLTTTEIDVETQVRLAMWEWLTHLGFVSDLQRRQIMTKFDHAIGHFCHLLQFKDGVLVKRGMPVFRLVLAEQRYAAWTGTDLWLDILYDELLDELPAPAVTTIVCDLSAMYCRLYDRVLGLRSRKDVDQHRNTAAEGECPPQPT